MGLCGLAVGAWDLVQRNWSETAAELGSLWLEDEEVCAQAVLNLSWSALTGLTHSPTLAPPPALLTCAPGLWLWISRITLDALNATATALQHQSILDPSTGVLVTHQPTDDAPSSSGYCSRACAFVELAPVVRLRPFACAVVVSPRAVFLLRLRLPSSICLQSRLRPRSSGGWNSSCVSGSISGF